MQRRGVIGLHDLDASENLIVLCTACDEVFNDPTVVWIFLPTSLNSIIAAEEEFHVRRTRAATAGERLPRPPPAPVAVLPVLYSRYQIRRDHIFTHVFTDAPIAMWAGSPLAAIIRSARLIAGVEMVSIREGGLPMDVALQLQRLLLLYGAPEPELGVGPQSALATIPAEPSGRPALRLPFRADRPTRPLPEQTDPGFASIGQTFTATLNYLAARSAQRNMSPEAHEWLTAEIRSTLSRLRTELRKLHENKDQPLLLPKFVFDRSHPLKLFSATIPFVLMRYSAEFEECMMRLFRACDLQGTCKTLKEGQRCLMSEITFRAQEEGTGECLFDKGFEDEFVRAAEAMGLEWV